MKSLPSIRYIAYPKRKLFKKHILLVSQIKAIKAAHEFIRRKELKEISFNRFIGFLKPDLKEEYENEKK